MRASWTNCYILYKKVGFHSKTNLYFHWIFNYFLCLKKVQNKVEKAEAIALLVNRGVVMEDKTIDYTEDGIPVRVLYVSQQRNRPDMVNLKKKKISNFFLIFFLFFVQVNYNSLNEYFSKFGTVERIQIINKTGQGPSRRPFSFGFVQFADPKVASR